MPDRKPSKPIILAAGLLAALGAVHPAHASDEPAVVAATVTGLLVPSDVGIAVAGLDAGPRPVIGWSLQIPIGSDRFDHRIVPAFEVLPWAGDTSVRGRLGYRYMGRDLFAGAGVGIDRAGINLSPEVGLKFAHAFHDNAFGFDFSMHLLARAEIAPESGRRLRGGTILFGWNFL